MSLKYYYIVEKLPQYKGRILYPIADNPMLDTVKESHIQSYFSCSYDDRQNTKAQITAKQKQITAEDA